jgi:hypothetical protein
MGFSSAPFSNSYGSEANMSTRLDDVPVIKIKTVDIDAAVFNRVRLALLRLENPLRLSLPGLRGMDVLLDGQNWVCVDRTLYDLPVLAWTGFETAGRSALHAPVGAKLHYYHIHANVLSETVLNTIDWLLQERLRPLSTNNEVTSVHGLFDAPAQQSR